MQMMEEMLRAKEREIDFKSKQIEEQEDETHDRLKEAFYYNVFRITRRLTKIIEVRLILMMS